MFTGKKRCKILKEIRRQIAENNDIEFITSECKHQGDCPGTCPKCEAEVRYLERELEKRMKLGKAVTVAGLAATITATTLLGTSCRPQIPMTERTEEFLAVQLPFVPADFANQSDEAIYTALKAALAEAQCLEEDARYVFIVHWDEDLYRSTESDGTITDTYSISSNPDKETWMVTREFLRLTFSATGTLLSASYVSQTAPQELGGDMAYVPEIYRPDNAQEVLAEKQSFRGGCAQIYPRPLERVLCALPRRRRLLPNRGGVPF